MEKLCIVCKSTFTVKTKWGKAKRERAQWCSQKCFHASWTPERRATIALNAKRYIDNETPEQRKSRMAKVIEMRVKNGTWKPPALGKKRELRKNVWLGDAATYNAKHRWIQKNWEKTGTCTFCGDEPEPFGNRKYGTEWANLDGEYNRNDKSTWEELCQRCHRRYDTNRRKGHIDAKEIQSSSKEASNNGAIT